MFYVYVLHSLKDGGLYIGFTADLRRRTLQNNAREAFATSHRGPLKLIYYGAYLEREDAIGRERFLKSGSGRKFLLKQLAHYFRKTPVRTARTLMPHHLANNPC